MTDKIRVVSESGDDYPENLSHETYQECEHEFISWHGSKPECQECGESPAQESVPPFRGNSVWRDARLDEWADGVYRKDNHND